MSVAPFLRPKALPLARSMPMNVGVLHFIGIGGIALGAALEIALLLSRGATRPIRELVRAARRIQAGTLDIFGQAAYPATTPAAFQITGVPGPAILIGCGRMYVAGLLTENHGERANAQWDPALAELSGSPQPPVTPPPMATEQNSVDFLRQPYLPGAALPTTAGTYLFYLDVWTRPITFLEDNQLIDKAVGVDVLTRMHDEMGPKPVTPDIVALWRDLGLKAQGDTIEFDDAAPLAAIRKAITETHSR